MDEPTNTNSDQDQTGSPSPSNTTFVEVRYSLKELMASVADERRESVLGRELVDAHEIDKMFSTARRRKTQ